MLNEVKLAVCPTSKEVIETAFYYSHVHKFPMFLCPTRNQVDYNGGYVFTTQQFSNFVDKQIKQYPQNWIYLCRNNCGPGFKDVKNDSLKEVYETIDADSKYGFDIMHFDVSNVRGTLSSKVKELQSLIKYTKKRAGDMAFDISFDKQTDELEFSSETINYVIEEVSKIQKPAIFSHRTGSLVKEVYQVGSIHKRIVGDIWNTVSALEIKLREHNGDYLGRKDLLERQNIVDIINIGPQLGAVQTSTVFQQALIYGIDLVDFQSLVHTEKKWVKWANTTKVMHPYYTAVFSGHYHYGSTQWKELIAKLRDCTDIDGIIAEALTQVYEVYRRWFAIKQKPTTT